MICVRGKGEYGIKEYPYLKEEFYKVPAQKIIKFHNGNRIMIYEQRPDNFYPKFEVSSCFLESNGEILALLRQDHKPEGNTWCLPAGKFNPKEDKTHLDTIVRETREETGIELPPESVSFFKRFYVKYPHYDFIYHVFRIILDQKPEVKINSAEHKEYRWLTPSEALRLNLIQDEDYSIKKFYNL